MTHESSAVSTPSGAAILERVTFAEYSQIQAVNLSTLKELRRSPAHYRHRLLTPREDTDAMRIGRCIHAAVLEPETFQAKCALWTGERRYGKTWNKFLTDNAGREILKREEWDLCLAVQRAVRGDKWAAPYLTGGKSELTIVWQDAETGIRCRCRLDYLADAIADVKTGRDMSPRAFESQSWKLGNHLQCAMYIDAVKASTGRDVGFAFIAVEVAEPHVVQVFQPSPALIEAGREEYKGLLRALKEYREQDRYPGYFDGVLDLNLPRWAVNDDEDVSELGLIIGGEQ